MGYTRDTWVRDEIRGTLFSLPTEGTDVSDASLDDRGRLTLPKELRERFGDRFHIVELHDGIKLVPVSEDPLDVLREEFGDVERSVEDLREGARETAIDRAGE